MGVGAGLSMYVVVVQKFTFAISSPDEFLLYIDGVPSVISTAFQTAAKLCHVTAWPLKVRRTQRDSEDVWKPCCDLTVEPSSTCLMNFVTVIWMLIVAVHIVNKFIYHHHQRT